MYNNLERSAFRRGEWTGYADGAWRIRRLNGPRGGWTAFHCHSPAVICARTLREISHRLTAYTTTKP